MYQAYYESPVGTLFLEADDTFLTRLDFVIEKSSSIKKVDSVVIEQTIQELDEYFQGKRKQFTIPLKQQGTTFQLAVWNALRDIPYATTKSYQDIAIDVGNKAAVRAIGLTNGKNSIAIIVPCHRVIGKNGKMVGYSSGVWRKEWLLQHELKHQ